MSGPESGSESPENRIKIPSKNWHLELAIALRHADENTVIIVDSEEKRGLALRAAGRTGKTIRVEVEAEVETATEAE